MRLIIILTFVCRKRFGLKPLQRLQPKKVSHACQAIFFNINADIHCKYSNLYLPPPIYFYIFIEIIFKFLVFKHAKQKRDFLIM